MGEGETDREGERRVRAGNGFCNFKVKSCSDLDQSVPWYWQL